MTATPRGDIFDVVIGKLNAKAAGQAASAGKGAKSGGASSLTDKVTTWLRGLSPSARDKTVAALQDAIDQVQSQPPEETSVPAEEGEPGGEGELGL